MAVGADYFIESAAQGYQLPDDTASTCRAFDMDDVNPLLAARVLSHGYPSEPLDRTIARVRDKIVARGDLAYVSVEEQLSLLEQLAEFPFGQFLLHNRGWNGFWTDYVMQHPEHGRLTGAAPDGRPLILLERQLLDTFPIVLATQERARHFAAAIQGHVKPGAVLASIPCGLMRDLLGCDFADTAAGLVGVDIDSDSFAQAERLAEARGLASIAMMPGCSTNARNLTLSRAMA